VNVYNPYLFSVETSSWDNVTRVIAGPTGPRGTFTVPGGITTEAIADLAITGAKIGLTTINGNNLASGIVISTSGAITTTNTTVSTSNTTGALQVSGGVGIGGNVYVGGNIICPSLIYNQVYPLYVNTTGSLPLELQEAANTSSSPTVIGGKYYIGGASMTIASGTASTLFSFTGIGIGVWLFVANIILTGTSTTATVDLVVDGTTRDMSQPFNSGGNGCASSITFVYSNNTTNKTISVKMSSVNHSFTDVNSASTATLTRIA
jgi:hypothetical protein